MSRHLLRFAAALAIAIGTMLFARHWLGAAMARSEAARPTTVAVLVAAHDLGIGARIDAAALRWTAWPVNASEGLITRGSAHSMSTDTRYIGAVVRIAMIAGEPVTPARLVQPGDHGAMAAMLAPGARAVTLAVTPASGMAGFLVPGDRVDVILTQTQPAIGDGSAERHLSSTVLRALRVLGTDQTSGASEPALAAAEGASKLGKFHDGPAAPATVTLEVSPKGAELLAVAEVLGKLSLSLRGLQSGTDGAASDAPTWDHDAAPMLPRQTMPAQVTPVAVASAAAPRAAPTLAVVRGMSAAQPDMVRGVSGSAVMASQ